MLSAWLCSSWHALPNGFDQDSLSLAAFTKKDLSPILAEILDHRLIGHRHRSTTGSKPISCDPGADVAEIPLSLRDIRDRFC